MKLLPRWTAVSSGGKSRLEEEELMAVDENLGGYILIWLPEEGLQRRI